MPRRSARSESVARDDAGAEFGQVAFAEVRILIEEILREDELKDGVAEKFEALIVEMMALGLVPEARVGQRFREQQGVAEFVLEALFERVHAGRTRSLSIAPGGWQTPSLQRGESGGCAKKRGVA